MPLFYPRRKGSEFEERKFRLLNDALRMDLLFCVIMSRILYWPIVKYSFESLDVNDNGNWILFPRLIESRDVN